MDVQREPVWKQETEDVCLLRAGLHGTFLAPKGLRLLPSLSA